jgi:hypothetical protein
MNDRHHRQKGDAPRVRLCNGPIIDPSTMAILYHWHSQGVSYGELIDRLVTHALASGYDPVTCQPPPTNDFPHLPH